MKKFIKKLIRITVCILVLYSCRSKEEGAGFESEFQKVVLNEEIQKLLKIYLESLEKVNPDEYVLRFGINEYDEQHFMILLSNFHKSQDAYEKGYEQKWKISDFEEFRIYVHDERNRISRPTKEKIILHYEKSKDSIVPDGYEGNLWEIHFRNDTLAEIHLMRTPKSIGEKAEEKIKQIEF
ncbi:hypothetical protein I215_15571 [Galbibacter marinus]|uniref:Lipoprotein n=1 Tax=Galbibacter marinus TaxID=555500 RepID=K2PQQ9_9FLAO|nr:hypothetical protein [Galbibacter marinus]EKF53829.1 hypothetical protein I215_15571 [Galbibacter marinus]